MRVVTLAGSAKACATPYRARREPSRSTAWRSAARASAVAGTGGRGAHPVRVHLAVGAQHDRRDSARLDPVHELSREALRLCREADHAVTRDGG